MGNTVEVVNDGSQPYGCYLEKVEKEISPGNYDMSIKWNQYESGYGKFNSHPICINPINDCVCPPGADCPTHGNDGGISFFRPRERLSLFSILLVLLTFTQY